MSKISWIVIFLESDNAHISREKVDAISADDAITIIKNKHELNKENILLVAMNGGAGPSAINIARDFMDFCVITD